jgi:hypothetical protein
MVADFSCPILVAAPMTLEGEAALRDDIKQPRLP